MDKIKFKIDYDDTAMDVVDTMSKAIKQFGLNVEMGYGGDGYIHYEITKNNKSEDKPTIPENPNLYDIFPEFGEVLSDSLLVSFNSLELFYNNILIGFGDFSDIGVEGLDGFECQYALGCGKYRCYSAEQLNKLSAFLGAEDRWLLLFFAWDVKHYPWYVEKTQTNSDSDSGYVQCTINWRGSFYRIEMNYMYGAYNGLDFSLEWDSKENKYILPIKKL